MGKFSFISTPQVPAPSVPQPTPVPQQGQMPAVPPVSVGSPFLQERIQSTPPVDFSEVPLPSATEDFTTEGVAPAAYSEPVEDPGFNLEEGQVVGEEPSAYDLYQQELMAEKQRQADVANVLDPSRWENQQSLMEAFPDVVKPTDAGALQRASLRIGEALNDIQTTRFDPNTTTPVNLNGLTDLKQGLGVSAKTAANTVTTSAILLAPVLAGAIQKGDGAIEGSQEVNDELSSLNSLLEDDGLGPMDNTAVAGGLKRDMMERVMGRLMKKLAKGASIDENLNPLDVKDNQNISNEQAGALGTQALIDSGFLTEDVDPNGIEIVRLSPGFGAELRDKSRQMQKHLTGALAGRAQSVPPTEEGDYVGALRNIRQGDKKKNLYTKTKAMTDAKYNVGKVPKLISPIKGYFAALFNDALLDHLADPTKPRTLDVNHLFKISEEDVQAAISGDDTAAKVIDQKAKNLQSELTDLAKHITSGAPKFTTYWEDYATHRLYEDATDLNEQRNKVTRATLVPVSTPFQMNSEYHKTGINKQTAEAFVNRMAGKARSRNFTMSPAERELSFLLTLGRVLNSSKAFGMSSESILMKDLLQTVTPQFIAEAAAKGRLLRSIAPNSKRDIVDAMSKPGSALQKLTPEQMGALKNFVAEADRDDWGYTLQAYLDAANYLDAKNNGTAFTPRLTVALDMNSAGRAFLAGDIGNMDILSRVGLVWDAFIDKVGDFFTDTLPDEVGDPRYFFSTVAQQQGIQKAFGEAEAEKNDMFKSLLLKYGGRGVKGNKKFNKDFAKKVLMTTDYGKPAMFHIQEAQDFLKSHPDFRDDALKFYNGDLDALAKDINEIYKSTLSLTTEEWQYTLPKRMVRFLQSVGRVPHPVGYWGEPISIGKFGAEPTGAVYQVTSSKGNRRRIQETKRMFDPLAKASSKVLDHGEVFHPDEGTAAQNQIGPTFGQYRESVIVAETANFINGGKAPEQSLFMSPVFDNFIVDSFSYPFVHYVANNIVAPKVFEWNMPEAFHKDFMQQIRDAMKDLDGKDEVLIGPGSPYRGLFVTLDREYKYIKDKKDAELSKPQLKFKQFLESPASGYVPPGKDRPEIVHMSVPQFKKNINELLEYLQLLSPRTGFKAWIGDEGIKQKRNEFINQLNKRAKQGLVYFFT